MPKHRSGRSRRRRRDYFFPYIPENKRSNPNPNPKVLVHHEVPSLKEYATKRYVKKCPHFEKNMDEYLTYDLKEIVISARLKNYYEATKTFDEKWCLKCSRCMGKKICGHKDFMNWGFH
jgi:hypothetical protein